MSKSAIAAQLFALVLILTSPLSALTPTANSPANQIIDAPLQPDIIVDFDEAVDQLSVNGGTFRVFGRWTGPTAGTILLENSDTRVRFVPASDFNAGEMVSVALSRGITDAGGDSLAQSYSWSFWIGTSPRPLRVDEVDILDIRQDGEGLVQSYGAYAGDFNDDGWTDLAIPNEIAVDVRLFLNDGAGGYSDFSIRPLPGGSYPSPNEGCDLNNDGLMDYVVGNAANNVVSVMIGDGSDTLSTPTNLFAGNFVRGLGIIDFNGDGFDDLITANRQGNTVTQFYNDGTGGFLAPNTFDAGMSGETALGVSDFNNDGLMDVVFGSIGSAEMALWLGDGNSIVLSDQISAGGNVWMVAVGDVNGDGNCDVVSANSSANNFSVIRGDGAGNLLPATTYPLSGAFFLAIDLGDLDGDGDLDLVVSDYNAGQWLIHENNGSGVFSHAQTLYTTGAASCATLHDRDNDGDLDISGIDEIDDVLVLFTNACDDNPSPTDSDGDDVFDPCDNCVNLANTNQADQDDDGIGDLCDSDRDGDGVDNDIDNCADFANAGQEDGDSDLVGDVCDNCPSVANTDQYDENDDGVGDACDGALHIQSYEVPDGYVDVPYDYEFSAVGGVPPYSWTLLGGDIPLGTTFNGGTDGSLSGIPTFAATYFFTVVCSDQSGPALEDTLAISVTILDAGYLCGDADGNDQVTVSDAVFVINFIFGGGAAPDPIELGDADCNGQVTISDAVYIINFIFGGGPAPCESCS